MAEQDGTLEKKGDFEEMTDNGVSMVDILEEEKQLESDANAVLGASDDKNCTYPKGYVGRQALYACTTCGKGREMAGICLACSLHCHEGHELYELYTKRLFRCDCGNSKFPVLKCKLSPDKDDINKQNRYNQNFKGVYCICSRPYPDPEDDIDDEMIQCVVCEDWLHGRHLAAKFPPDHDFHEMICADCMKKCDFLWAYLPQSKNTCVVSKTETESQDVKVDVDSKAEAPGEGSSSSVDTSVNKVEPEDSDIPSSSSCMLKTLNSREIIPGDGSVFWPDGWRSKLCQCATCLELYSTLDVGFLIDETDPVQHYEDRGQAKASSSQYDSGMQALSSMDRVQLGEMIHGYNDMKNSLREYLKKFAENKRVVREEDIREFFGEMEARKRRRTDNL